MAIIKIIPYLIGKKSKTIIITFFCFFSQYLISQSKNEISFSENYPPSFSISETELFALFNYAINDKINSTSNIYLNKSIVNYKYISAEVKQLKIKLAYFKDSELIIQLNADSSKQIFVLSRNDLINYKNSSYRPSDTIRMIKCKKDEILTE